MTKSVIDVGRMEELSQLWGQYLGQFTEDFCNFYNSIKGDDINIPLQKDEDWSLTGTRIEREVTEQEKQEMKEQLLAKFGRFDDQVALSILESCDYVWSAVVFHAEELLAEQAAIGLASDEDADKVDHPTFDRICNERPHESRKLIALAVRKTLFNYEHALVYLDNPKMRDVLDAELQKREAERLKKAMPKKDIIIGAPGQGKSKNVSLPQVPEVEVSRQASTEYKRWKTKTVDLHGFSKRDALLEVQQTLTDVVRSRGFDKINFITGQGKHSKGEAVLKPAVLFYLQNMGCQRRIHPRNPGIVEAFPFGDMY